MNVLDSILQCLTNMEEPKKISLKAIAGAGPKLMRELAAEVKDVLATTGENKITLQALEKMALVNSVTYECFRLNPPVPYQYGRAKKDFIIESHDASYKIKNGEMLFGYQPFATRDPKVFVDPDTFVPKRFLGPEGEKLISSVFWSNGRETDEPTVGNKQCPAKDLVVTISRLFVAEFFNRYERFELAPSPVGSPSPTSLVTFISLKKNITSS
jgi:hydroperoxide dehydratase